MALPSRGVGLGGGPREHPRCVRGARAVCLAPSSSLLRADLVGPGLRSSSRWRRRSRRRRSSRRRPSRRRRRSRRRRSSDAPLMRRRWSRRLEVLHSSLCLALARRHSSRRSPLFTLSCACAEACSSSAARGRRVGGAWDGGRSDIDDAQSLQFEQSSQA